MLWFGKQAAIETGGKLYRNLKLALLEHNGVCDVADLPDILVCGYFSWVLHALREWVDQKYGFANTRLFLNVAAPMDHLGDLRTRTKYLKILKVAGGVLWGREGRQASQGIALDDVSSWWSEDNAVPALAVRPYDVLPETGAPIVSLSQDPRMPIGMYLLVDMGAGTTEISINHVSAPGGDQNVLCYYDRSILLGAAKFEASTDRANLIEQLQRNLWQTWSTGFRKDADNRAARERWKRLRILLLGGGTFRSDVRECIMNQDQAVHNVFRNEARCEVVRHHPANLSFEQGHLTPNELSLVSVANGLAFPRMQWPKFYEPNDVPPMHAPTLHGGHDPWYLDR